MKLPRFNEANYAHFVTTKTFQNKPLFKNESCCEILLKDIDFYRNKLGFKLIGYVIMHDHLHLIVLWDVDESKGLTISKITQSIKSHSGRQITDYLYNVGGRDPLTSSKHRLGQGTQATHDGYPHRRMSKSRYKIWQASFYDFNIYSDEKLQQKLDYIHYNPVQAGLCRNPEDWPWSSASYYQTGQVGKIKIDNTEI